MTKTKIKEVKCIVCKSVIPAGRIKALGSHINTCVEHSDATRKFGTSFTNGDVDDGYTDIHILSDPAEIEAFKRLSKQSYSKSNKTSDE